MSHHVLTVDLRDDPAAIAAYRAHHQRVWPEVVESLHRVGITRMDIHMHGRRLVMILELADGVDVRRAFAAHAASPNPRVQEWERLMRSLQERISEAPPGEWWTMMEPVFQLS
jgi:L-rhamnose mutarotase